MDPLSKLVHECRWISGFFLTLQVNVTEIACGVVSPDFIFWQHETTVENLSVFTGHSFD